MKHTRPAGLVLTIFMAVAGAAAVADDGLPRRGFLGVLVEAAPDGAAGLSVTRVIPDSTAQLVGLQPGDIITEFNGEATTTPRAFALSLGARRAGDPLQFEFLRDGRSLERSVDLGPFPEELMTHSRHRYGAVTVPGGYRLRTIVTVPIGAREPGPAFLFLQGLSCATVDTPFAPADDSIIALIDGVAAAGFVTMRIDKPGVGDSEGPDCSEIDFETELAGFRAGLEALKQDEFVDPDRVFLFGHSMGGVMAPVLARDEPVRGVAVYGTIAKNFLEYLVENKRRQLPRDGLTGAAAEESVRAYHEFMARFLLDAMTPAEIVDRYPTLAGAVENTDDEHFFGRHASFYHQLNRTRTANAWAEVDAHVIALHGAYDWVSARGDHEQIAAIVNGARPDHGRFVELPGLDHGFRAHESIEASYRDDPRGTASDLVLRTVLAWMTELGAEAG